MEFSGNSSWPSHEWDFGDGSDESGGSGLSHVTHVYQDINPFTTTVVARHRLDASSPWCEQEITFPGITIGSGCGTTRSLSTLISNGILPASTLSSKTVYLYGDLELDGPYTFSACTLKVMAGGRIIVKSGGKLVLANGTVATNNPGDTGCDFLWNGIEVKTGGQLVTDGATIQNAYFAVRPILQQKGQVPILNLNNTTFSRDFIGIYAAAGAFNVAKFSANTFEGSGNTAILNVGTCNTPASISGIPFAQRTYAGIYFDATWGENYPFRLAPLRTSLRICKRGSLC